MKRILKSLLFFLALTLTFSCEKWMDLIPPTGLVREEFWQSKEDVESVLMGAYKTFGEMDDKLWLYGELRGDMVIGDYMQDNGQRQIQEGNIYSTNWLCNWADFYSVINYCNEVIKNAPLVQDIDETFTDFLLQGYLSEAYFLRSLSYFYLVRIFKDVPYVTTPTESDDTEIYVKKMDGDSILNFILTDLEEYRKYITIDGYITEEENKGRATRAAYDALLADINLWQFNYEDVITHCSNILYSEKELYELVAPDDWFDLYNPGNSFEGIFEFQFETSRGQNNSLYGLTRQYAYLYDPSQTAIDMFSMENGEEPRRGEDASIKKISEGDYIIWKYVGYASDGQTERPGSMQTSANFIVYRLSDVYLMMAEAYSQLGMFTEASSLISELTEERDASVSEIEETKNSYEDVIMDQRARELAFEGKRWFDLMRMGRRNDYSRKGKVIEIVVTNVPSTQKRILASKLNDPLSWYLPIYENELERNKNLEQNPFYKN